MPDFIGQLAPPPAMLADLQAKLDAAQAAATQALTASSNARAMAQAAQSDANAVSSQQQTQASTITSLQQLAANVSTLSDASTADRAAIHKQLDTLAAQAIGVGVTATPVLALAASVDVTVPLSRTMATTTYTLDWATSLPRTSYTVTEKTRTASSVTLNLKATLAVGAGTIVVLVRG